MDFQEMIREEIRRKRLEKAGFRVISEPVVETDRLASKYPAGHCWHLTPRGDPGDVDGQPERRDPDRR